MSAFIATQVADGGLWHAGIAASYDGGYADTLCGRWGWVDHQAQADDAPVLAVLDDPLLGQTVECLRCRSAMVRESV